MASGETGSRVSLSMRPHSWQRNPSESICSDRFFFIRLQILRRRTPIMLTAPLPPFQPRKQEACVMTKGLTLFGVSIVVGAAGAPQGERQGRTHSCAAYARYVDEHHRGD